MPHHLSLIAATICLLASVATAQDRVALPEYVISEFGVPPKVPTDTLSKQAADALEEVLAISASQSEWSSQDTAAFDAIAAAGDPRIVWILTDILRFAWRPDFHGALTNDT